MAEPVEVPKLSFVVKQFVDAAQLKRDLTIHPDEVSNAMLEHASRFVEYGVYFSKASKQVDDLKMVWEAVEAKVYKILRNEAAAAKEKVTEVQLEKQVRVHPKVIAYRRLLNEAKQVESLAKSGVEAFRQRKDMLISFGMLQREEMKGEVSMSRRQAVADENTSLRERTLARTIRESEVTPEAA